MSYPTYPPAQPVYPTYPQAPGMTPQKHALLGQLTDPPQVDYYRSAERRPLGEMSVDELLAEYAALRPAAEQTRTQLDALVEAEREYRDRLAAIARVLPARIADEHDQAPTEGDAAAENTPAPWDLDAPAVRHRGSRN
ncbi:hypothetical protein [Pseudonocardia sp. McavD-2-B]|uniref:hypothetical protein n=1 Tax=Pseudonocardia sp. McavD-2-B TaxID=2954499 RepID=UPI00209808C6|nr:hypothetical protein [Pseudonocardia sp. McavD-2-B]MCO7192308.1 hypothetical protein [Pseudonocardia sp. McavD-2-B]